MLFSSRVRVRIRVMIIFSVWLVSCYAHVFVRLKLVIVTHRQYTRCNDVMDVIGMTRRRHVRGISLFNVNKDSVNMRKFIRQGYSQTVYFRRL